MGMPLDFLTRLDAAESRDASRDASRRSDTLSSVPSQRSGAAHAADAVQPKAEERHSGMRHRRRSGAGERKHQHSSQQHEYAEPGSQRGASGGGAGTSERRSPAPRRRTADAESNGKVRSSRHSQHASAAAARTGTPPPSSPACGLSVGFAAVATPSSAATGTASIEANGSRRRGKSAIGGGHSGHASSSKGESSGHRAAHHWRSCASVTHARSFANTTAVV